MKKILMIVALAGLIAVDSKAEVELNNDLCHVSVLALAQGVANSYQNYNQKPATILNLKLIMTDELRTYSLDLTHDSRIDSYEIILENDSAYRCLLNKIAPVEIGG